MGLLSRSSSAKTILEAKSEEIKQIYKDKKGWDIKLSLNGENIEGEYREVKFPIIQGSDDGNLGYWVDESNFDWDEIFPTELMEYLEGERDE